MAEEFNNEELEFTPEVVQEEVAPIVAEEPVEAPAPVVEEAPAPKKKAKKSAPKTAKKEPGMYHNGRLITAVPARLGKKWTVVIDGKREKVLKQDIEIVK